MWWLWGKWQLHCQGAAMGCGTVVVTGRCVGQCLLLLAFGRVLDGVLLDENGWQVCGRAVDQHCAVVVTGNGPS